jgi:hypothetical protein
MKDPKEILAQAEDASRKVETWADLWNLLFAPETGLVIRAYPTEAERAWFLKTKEHKAIRELVTAAMRRFGAVEGATPRKSGRFLVRVPRSLHERLEHEAAKEGVSLNQLVVYLLSAQVGTFQAPKTASRVTSRTVHFRPAAVRKRKLQPA